MSNRPSEKLNMGDNRTIDGVACVSCGAIGQHLEGCRFAPKEYRPSNLVAELREIRHGRIGDVCEKAADALEAKDKEIERLTLQLTNQVAHDLIVTGLEKQIERLTRELQGTKDELDSVDKAAKELGAERDRLREGHAVLKTALADSDTEIARLRAALERIKALSIGVLNTIASEALAGAAASEALAGAADETARCPVIMQYGTEQIQCLKRAGHSEYCEFR